MCKADATMTFLSLIKVMNINTETATFNTHYIRVAVQSDPYITRGGLKVRSQIYFCLFSGKLNYILKLF